MATHVAVHNVSQTMDQRKFEVSTKYYLIIFHSTTCLLYVYAVLLRLIPKRYVIKKPDCVYYRPWLTVTGQDLCGGWLEIIISISHCFVRCNCWHNFVNGIYLDAHTGIHTHRHTHTQACTYTHSITVAFHSLQQSCTLTKLHIQTFRSSVRVTVVSVVVHSNLNPHDKLSTVIFAIIIIDVKGFKGASICEGLPLWVVSLKLMYSEEVNRDLYSYISEKPLTWLGCCWGESSQPQLPMIKWYEYCSDWELESRGYDSPGHLHAGM